MPSERTFQLLISIQPFILPCAMFRLFCFLLILPNLKAAPTGEVKIVQTTPIELSGVGITFEKLDFTFGSPVTARFWMEYDAGKGKPSRGEVPHDYVLPTNHYAFSYLQLANDQVSLSVTTDSPAPGNRRTGGYGGPDSSGSREVIYQLTSTHIGLGRNIELFRATVKPSWRHSEDPTKVTKIMVRFSEAVFPEDPIPLEDNAAWKKITDGRVAILRQDRNSFEFKDVSPKILVGLTKENPDTSFWPQRVDLCALDANQAWVAVVAKKGDQPQVWIEQTADGGKHWKQFPAPAADSVKISFVNSHCGFLLAMGSPSAGLMRKEVYSTTDGAAHWQLLTMLGAEGQSFYPTGLFFRTPQEGWITATYHGSPAAPLFHTRDGGQSWQVQELEFPPDFSGGHADVFAPFFYPRHLHTDQMEGELPVKLVSRMSVPDHQEWIYYLTEDGGLTWHLPPSKPEN